MVNWLGTDQADVYHGSPDDDHLSGRGNDDILYGSGGNDSIAGESGRDLLYGDAGNDSLDGGDDDDLLYGQDGNDILAGGGGKDSLYGYAGRDTIVGDFGDDRLYGGDDDDDITGNAGNDMILGENGNDIIDGGDDNDLILGGDGKDTILGRFGNDTIHGEEGNDLIAGGDGNDVLDGGAGDDALDGGDGDDVMTGGLGRDTFTTSDAGRGNSTITDFNIRAGENDVADLTGLFAGHDMLLKASTVLPVDGVTSTRIALDNGGTVTLRGYDITKDASLQTHFKVGASGTFDLLDLTAEQQITATYAAFLGRGPDAGGLAFWVDQFNAGSLTQGRAELFANIANSVGASGEARALHPFLANPFGASDGQISTFIDSVYHNLFDRGADAAGLAYWTGQAKQTLQVGQFIGPIVADIMSGACNQDMTTLMDKAAASDTAAATSLPETVALIGITNDETLIAAQA